LFDDSQVLALGFRVNTSTTTNASDTSFAGPQWYILKVAFNREDSIREALEKRIKLSSFKEYFGDILVPTEDVVEFTRAGKRRVIKRKLYPGYLMIQMIITDDTWFLVRETPGIGDFTGTYGKPTPMTEADVERIIKLVHPDVDQEHVPKTTIPFRPGDRVRVKEGNFQSLEGDVDRIDEANGRVTVIINIFGRSTPVELDHWQIESL
jgi:transcriptional antiterminator NusG